MAALVLAASSVPPSDVASAAARVPAAPSDAAAAPDDDAERAVLWLTAGDVRSDLCRQQRAIGRLRAKLATVADRKAPLLAALQAELGAQQSAIGRLRSQLGAQRAAFSSDESAAYAVYDAALRAIEANSRAALSAAEAEVGSLVAAHNELASFALVEAALQTKCDQLARKNADNEGKHQQRLAAMRAEWSDSRAALQEAASRARQDSERRYKQQVMAAINISYGRISDEIDAMQRNKQAEVRQLSGLDAAIQQCRRTIADERGRGRDELTQRADSQRALFDARLQLRQLGRDTAHEQHKAEEHRAHEEHRRREARADRRSTHQRLESELRGWRAACSAHGQSLRRVRAVTREVDRARKHNCFQQLVEECIEDARGDSSVQPTIDQPLPVAAMSGEDRQRILRLLFVRIRQAETERLQRQHTQQPVAEHAAANEGTEDGVQDGVQAADVAAHGGPSFFLTQHQLDDTKEQVNSDAG